MGTLHLPVVTPCGTIQVSVEVPDLPGLPSLPIPFPFPPKFAWPMADCASIKRLATSAPEPPEDSEP